MIVTGFEKKEKCAVEFTVTADAAEFEAAVNKAYLKNKKNIMIPGFRKGKAPRMVIEGMYGPQTFYEDAVEFMAPEAFELAIKEHELEIVGGQGIKDFNVGEDGGVTMVFTADTYPEVTLGEYKGLTAPRKADEITDADVDAEVDKLRDRNARIQPVDRAAQLGDTANIDFEGYVDGVAFDGGKGKGHDLELGSGAFIPGFEDQVVGMSAGEEKDISVTFPENYSEGLSGKEAVFHVTLNSLTVKELPAADDEFAKDVSEFDTLAEYRASLRADLEKKSAENAEDAFKSALMDKAVANVQCELPDSMVAARTDTLIKDYARNLERNGISMEQYMKMTGANMETLRTYMSSTARRNLMTEVLLRKVAETEGIVASDEDVEAEYTKMAGDYNMPVEVIKNAVAAEDVRLSLTTGKAADLIFESGVVGENEPEEKAEKTEAEAE